MDTGDTYFVAMGVLTIVWIVIVVIGHRAIGRERDIRQKKEQLKQ